jgi:hypothetical protein
MTGIRRAIGALAVTLGTVTLAAAGCGMQQAEAEWDPAAARAVARHMQDATPAARIVVLATAGLGGAELPWGVRQSLTTGGVEVVDRDPATPGTALLIFEQSSRSDGDWLIDTTLHADTATSTPPARGSWRVRCEGDQCTVRGMET